FSLSESCSCERRKLERTEKTVQPGAGDERSVQDPGNRPVYRPEQSVGKGEQSERVLEETPPRERLIDDAITASFLADGWPSGTRSGRPNSSLNRLAELAADDPPCIPDGRLRRNRREAARGRLGHRRFTPRHNVRAEQNERSPRQRIYAERVSQEEERQDGRHNDLEQDQESGDRRRDRAHTRDVQQEWRKGRDEAEISNPQPTTPIRRERPSHEEGRDRREERGRRKDPRRQGDVIPAAVDHLLRTDDVERPDHARDENEHVADELSSGERRGIELRSDHDDP